MGAGLAWGLHTDGTPVAQAEWCTNLFATAACRSSSFLGAAFNFLKSGPSGPSSPRRSSGGHIKCMGFPKRFLLSILYAFMLFKNDLVVIVVYRALLLAI